MIKQKLKQKNSFSLLPQHIRLIKILEMPIMDFEQVVREEIEDNPALENLDEKEEQNKDDYLPSNNKYKNLYNKNIERENIQVSKVSLTDFLESQLTSFNLSEKHYKLSYFLIGNIDDNGYITRDIEYIVEDIFLNQNIKTSVKELEYVLHNVIFNLQPPGIGARNIKECLLLQLSKEENNQKNKLCIDIIKNHFELFVKKKYDLISKKLKVKIDNIENAANEIKKLTPKPGLSFEVSLKNNLETIIPDFIVNIDGDKINLELYEKNIPEITLSNRYKKMLEDVKKNKSKNNKDIKDFLTKKLEDANSFVKLIYQRQDTLKKTISIIIEKQKDYLLTGDKSKIKPLILKDIAEKLDMQISTISRVTNRKYIRTPYGTLPLKNFFSESVKNQKGELTSTQKIKTILQDIIENENKKNPYSDIQLTEKMKKKGYNMSRRTFTKYREQLKIPSSSIRKKI